MFRPFSWSLVMALLAGSASTTGWAAPLRQAYRLQDHGRVREFEIARDEVHVSRQAKRVPAKASVEEARKAAAEAGGDLVLYEKGQPRTTANRRLVTKRVAMQLAAGIDPAVVAAAGGVTLVGPVPGAPGWLLMEADQQPGSALEAAERLRKIRGVLAADPQLARQQSKKLRPNDPLFADEFFLLNTGQAQGQSGLDFNVTPVWDTYKGEGVVIGIVDDGLQRNHPDLAPNYRAALSYDFNERNADPLPPRFTGDDHGTSCAGLAAARGNNGLGVCGVAYAAGLAGLRLIALPNTDADEAAAMAFRDDAIHIKSNSWGPEDDGLTLEGPGPLVAAAFAQAVRTGRGGLGTIITWAGGNGADFGDSSAFDGYANRREVIAVGGIENNGRHTFYAEPGPNIMVAGFTDSRTIGISTIDRPGLDGYNFPGAPGEYPNRDYTKTFSGTSGATPMISGVIALILQARPTLGWRDVQEILIRTARRVGSKSFVTNGAGLRFSNDVGAGLPDAAAAVALAQTWTNLPPEVLQEQTLGPLATPIPDNRAGGIEQTFVFNDPRLRVEHVTLELDAVHAQRGQLEVTLTSPAGTVTQMMPTRPRDRGANYLGTTLTTAHYWGEMAAGTWRVRVADRARETVGTLQRLNLRLYGSSPQGHVEPAGLTVTAGTLSAVGNVAPGETVTVAFQLRNNGATALVEPAVTLLPTAGVSAPSASVTLPTIPAGGVGAAIFSFTAAEALGTTIYPMLEVRESGVLTGTAVYPITLGRLQTRTFTKNGVIQLPQLGTTTGNAAPYGSPLTVNVGPKTAVITKVVLRLVRLRHTITRDLDFLLVSPSGQRMIPLSDAGGEEANGINLTLDDDAEVTAPSTALLSPGRARPANHGSAIDSFPAPAPRRPYGSNFALFRGENPQGVWRLYARDDAQQDVGTLGGWALEITFAQ